jgi:hypothetical protein
MTPFESFSTFRHHLSKKSANFPTQYVKSTTKHDTNYEKYAYKDGTGLPFNVCIAYRISG